MFWMTYIEYIVLHAENIKQYCKGVSLKMGSKIKKEYTYLFIHVYL